VIYNKKITRLSNCKGYGRFCDTEHPLAHKDGMVYYHRHVASLKIGRWLLHSEHIHHVDGNRSNNDPNNLEIVTIQEHAKIHAHKKEILTLACKLCGRKFITNRSCAKYCSYKCSRLARRKLNPTKEELKRLVWEMPTVRVAEKYGVSDKAIAKRCIRLGIEKPPRGYWRKVETGTL